jgi:hypothetical protein
MINFQGLWLSFPHCEAARGRKMGCSVPSAIALNCTMQPVAAVGRLRY